MSKDASKSGMLAVGGVAAIFLASTCCLGPLLLVSVGLGGAWVSNLQVLETFRPAFIAAALISLFFAWKRIYGAPATCATGDACAVPAARRAYKGIFWVVAGLCLPGGRADSDGGNRDTRTHDGRHHGACAGRSQLPTVAKLASG